MTGITQPAEADSAGQVARHVLRLGPVPRGAVARALGLSAGSLTRLGSALLDAGVLVETDPVADPVTRRPTRPLDVALDAHRFLGVALADGSAWGVLTDLRAGVRARARVPLAGATPDAVVAAVAALAGELGAPRPDGVGLAVDGQVDATGRVQAEVLGRRPPVDLAGPLREATGADVLVGDDLTCFTRTEHWTGLGREHTGFAVLALGSGVGHGLVVADRVVESPDAGLQPLGHLPLEPTGPRCPRGHRGCATALLGTPALLAAAQVATGLPTTWPELLADAVDGDRRARQVLDDAAAHLGRLVALVAGVTGVDQVLLVGAGADLAVVGYEALRAALDGHRDPRARPVELTVRDHDPHDWARGAAGAAAQAFATGPRWLAGVRR
ncbi:ROK family protein [Klenkia sp. PcliD-1-E]|uniref:ROK family protein n=1 Tax=Klenkia sp. PcliD-1-E TaxID=2954492 RepID=UPI0020985336|nr:ROK family protein [Klenkia sp. PcliD-1-E]MCO7220798.1 ROK family protein [Klenkia sp. PcliD-1-E]